MIIDSKMRNKENYSQGISMDNLSLTGINELNCLNGTKLMALMQLTIINN